MAERQPLTTTEQKLYDFLRSELLAGKGAPTWPGIALHMGWRSTRSAGYHLGNLEEKGWIRRTAGQRGIELVGETLGAFELPYGGEIAAGAPMPACPPAMPKICISEFFGGDTVIYQVRGHSMREAGIFNGDYVAVRLNPEAVNGDMVLASIDGELTLKTLRLGGDGLWWLDPHNPDHKSFPMKVGDDNKVIGVYTSLVRAVKRPE